jgi:hypothetical protein
MSWTPFTPKFRSNAEASLATVPKPLDAGALRQGGGNCWEIMFVGGSDAGYYWVPYDPANATHTYFANLYHRYGRGLSQYYWHGRDAESFPDMYWQVVYGRPLVFGSIEHLDTWYHPTLLKSLEAEYWRKVGREGPVCGQGGCEAGESWETCPVDCPRPVTPGNPACDGLCHAADKICEGGRVTGGRCPEDCEAPCPAPEAPPAPQCPAVDAAACAPFMAPIQGELAGCGARAAACDRESVVVLSSLREVEGKLSNASRSLAARNIEVKALTVERDGCKASLALCRPQVRAPLPAELAAILREERARARGAGQRARAGRAIRAACAVYICPAGGL